MVAWYSSQTLAGPWRDPGLRPVDGGSGRKNTEKHRVDWVFGASFLRVVDLELAQTLEVIDS